MKFCPLNYACSHPKCTEENCAWYSADKQKCIILAVGEALITPVKIKPYDVGDIWSSFFGGISANKENEIK